MKFQITPDQNFCSFGDGIIYKFVPFTPARFKNPCWECSFFDPKALYEGSSLCPLVPCQKDFRSDEKDGFWQKTQCIDFQTFEKKCEFSG